MRKVLFLRDYMTWMFKNCFCNYKWAIVLFINVDHHWTPRELDMLFGPNFTFDFSLNTMRTLKSSSSSPLSVCFSGRFWPSGLRQSAPGFPTPLCNRFNSRILTFKGQSWFQTVNWNVNNHYSNWFLSLNPVLNPVLSVSPTDSGVVMASRQGYTHTTVTTTTTTWNSQAYWGKFS